MALLDIEGELLRGAVAGAGRSRTTRWRCIATSPMRTAVANAMATVSARFGRLDALVNNAGIAVFAPLLDTSDDDWSRILAGQPHRAVHLHQGGGAADARTWRRRDRQHHLDLGGARLDAALGLRHQQGRAGASDQTARGRTGLARHSRQRGGARPGRDRDGEAGPYAGNPRRLSRRHSAQPLRPGGGTGGSDLLPVQRSCRATSPGRSSRSTAVSTPPASACRRCAASGGTWGEQADQRTIL